MIFVWLIGMFTSIIGTILMIMPDVSSFPLPIWFTVSAFKSFSVMLRILSLPIIREIWLYFQWYFGIWLALRSFNFVMKFLSFFPFFAGFDKFKIRD